MSSAKRARAPQVRAYRNRLNQNGPEHLANHILEPRVARKSPAKRARAPQTRACRSPGFRGCLKRNGPEHPENQIMERRVLRMSEAGETGQFTFGQRTSEPRHPRTYPKSNEIDQNTSRTSSWNPEWRGCPRRCATRHHPDISRVCPRCDKSTPLDARAFYSSPPGWDAN